MRYPLPLFTGLRCYGFTLLFVTRYRIFPLLRAVAPLLRSLLLTFVSTLFPLPSHVTFGCSTLVLSLPLRLACFVRTPLPLPHRYAVTVAVCRCFAFTLRDCSARCCAVHCAVTLPTLRLLLSFVHQCTYRCQLVVMH